jgi:endonuclease/exonuclease/phosphatase family metal-dependent hydrolase
MHNRMPIGVALALALLLGMGACVDDPSSPILAPDDAALARGGPVASSVPVRLLSRNMYLGGNIDHVLEDPVSGGATAWAEIMYTNYPERAAVMAAEILDRKPHLVGLQEVSRYLVFAPDFSPLGGFDYLDILMMYLAPHGYEIVTRAQNFQAIIPMGGLYVQYTDGDAILKLSGVDVHDADWKRFDVQVNLGDYVPGLGFNYRSFQWADVTVEGQRFLFVNTHMEVQRWAEVQLLQTEELLDFVDGTDLPVIMTGDFNSAANRNAEERAMTGTYAMILEAGFDDLWLPHNGVANNSGASCCQASDLSNPTSKLDERIDFIFARDVPYWKGNRSASARLQLLGHRPSDRFKTSLGYYLWPSDHAGLFGEILFGH